MMRSLHRLRRALAPWLAGPGATVGVLAGGCALLLAGPGVAAPVAVAGLAAARRLIRHRPMTAREREFAAQVFGPALPGSRPVVITDLAGLGGSCFVVPAIDGQILVNLGRGAYEDPVAFRCPGYPGAGKLFIHELAHAWQLAHGEYFPRLGRRLLAGPGAGHDFYRPPAQLAPPWPPLNLEQQATVVDEWFCPGPLGPPGWAGTPGMSESHPYWPYVRDVVRAAPRRV